MDRVTLVLSVLVTLYLACSAPDPVPHAVIGGGDVHGAPVALHCGAGVNDQGCSCTQVGRTQSCCGTGTQSCERNNEFSTWSACTGAAGAPLGCGLCQNVELSNCGDGASPPHNQPSQGGVGAPDAGAGVQPPGCECRPGATRWCDEPTYCLWGRQTCLPDGTFGPCTEVTDVPASCDPAGYDPDCCVQAGLCCQDVFGSSDGSIGQCQGVVCQ